MSEGTPGSLHARSMLGTEDLSVWFEGEGTTCQARGVQAVGGWVQGPEVPARVAGRVWGSWVRLWEAGRVLQVLSQEHLESGVWAD